MISDLVGYIATAVTLLSFTQSSILKIRIVNSIGALLWICYGAMIFSFPNMITNTLILIIHSVWFFKNRKDIFM